MIIRMYSKGQRHLAGGRPKQSLLIRQYYVMNFLNFGHLEIDLLDVGIITVLICALGLLLAHLSRMLSG